MFSKLYVKRSMDLASLLTVKHFAGTLVKRTKVALRKILVFILVPGGRVQCKIRVWTDCMGTGKKSGRIQPAASATAGKF